MSLVSDCELSGRLGFMCSELMDVGDLGIPLLQNLKDKRGK